MKPLKCIYITAEIVTVNLIWKRLSPVTVSVKIWQGEDMGEFKKNFFTMLLYDLMITGEIVLLK
jgi:L-rhamnose isomerase